MDYIAPQEPTVGVILCCDCGASIQPNPTNRCLACLRARNDITEDIPKQGTLYFCRGCERYLEPPNQWVLAPLESKELLKLCLKKLKGLNRVRLVDAGFAWTEPHSKRIKVKLSVQKEIQAGAVLQQDFIVEFTVAGQMCDDCHRIEAKDYWTAMVQVRQKTDHKRTFYYLEQMILRHRAHEKTLGIKPVHEGLDFFFATEAFARKLLDFFNAVIPCRWTHSKKLISHDIHSNTYNYKHTYSVEIVPICKDSVVCLPAKLARQLGGIGQVCVVLRVTNIVILIDPSTAQLAEVPAATYWRSPFPPLCTSKRLVNFVVMDANEADVRRFKGQGHISNKHQVFEVWVQRESELGTDHMIFCRTHLGHLLSPGDVVKGFDLRQSNVNDDSLDAMDQDLLPDVVLVKKVYSNPDSRARKRKFKLKRLDLDDAASTNMDYNDFLEDLEEDQQLRANVNIYRDTDKCGGDTDSEYGDAPSISVAEMMEDLVENDAGKEAEGEEEMME